MKPDKEDTPSLDFIVWASLFIFAAFVAVMCTSWYIKLDGVEYQATSPEQTGDNIIVEGFED